MTYKAKAGDKLSLKVGKTITDITVIEVEVYS